VIVLGLDPSLTNFGWCLHDTNATDRDTVVDRGRWQTPAKMEFIDRYMQMRSWLQDKIEESKPDFMGIEYPVFNDLWSEGMYGLFLYSCEAIKSRGMDVVFFSPGQIKAHARLFLRRPRGWKMDKPDMVEAAKKAAGGGRWNHNEADAFWVARTAGRFWDYFTGELGEDGLTPIESKQFTEIHTFQRGKRAGETVKRGIVHRESERFFRWSRSPHG
jgi:Holliday junction resolvasome RuvABC endonuclease subunit